MLVEIKPRNFRAILHVLGIDPEALKRGVDLLQAL